MQVGPVLGVIAYLAAYLAAGLSIAHAWRDQRISSRTAALLRAGRWASVPIAIGIWRGELLTPLVLILTVAMFAYSAVLNLFIFGRMKPSGPD